MSKPSTWWARRGASLTEYIVLIGAVALAVVPAATLYGRKIASLFAGASGVLHGQATPPDRPGNEPPATEPPAPPGGGNPPPQDGGQPPSGEEEPPAGEDESSPPADDDTLFEHKDRTCHIRVGKDGTAEATFYDEFGNKKLKVTAASVPARELGYDKALFTGKGTLNFCNSSTYTAELAVAAGKFELGGIGGKIGMDQFTRDPGDSGWKKGTPEASLEWNFGGEGNLLEVKGG